MRVLHFLNIQELTDRRDAINCHWYVPALHSVIKNVCPMWLTSGTTSNLVTDEYGYKIKSRGGQISKMEFALVQFDLLVANASGCYKRALNLHTSDTCQNSLHPSCTRH